MKTVTTLLITLPSFPEPFQEIYINIPITYSQKPVLLRYWYGLTPQGIQACPGGCRKCLYFSRVHFFTSACIF